MGCKSNQFEGSVIEENLVKSGFEKGSKIFDADFFILNSCTVTHKSDNEAFSILKRAKKDSPQVITVITGCIAQVEKQKLLEHEFIDIVVGNDEKFDIANYLEKNSGAFVADIMDLDRFHSVYLEDTTKTRASLKIQDGCDNRCSYCIIPFARGKNRSADEDFILNQIDKYKTNGFKEIMLTGIHIGQWGKDFSPKNNLLNLLKKIDEKNIRYRLGSLNPLEIDDEILEFLAQSKNFCPHFHLSLQSACDKTLKSMNRFYSVDSYLELIEKIKEKFPLAFIGSDVIAGFAGESEEDFQTTLKNLKKSKLTQIHTFPYSIRKNTQAESFEGHLEFKEKERRANFIKEISAQKYQQFLQSNLNSTQEVLIEKKLDAKTGMYKGVSKNYLKIFVKSDDKIGFNSLQKVKIISIDDKIIAEPI